MIFFSKILNNIFLFRQWLKGLASNLFGLLYFKIYFSATIFINLLNWILAIFINQKNTADQVILHYNVDFGANLIGNEKQLYTLPLLALTIFLVNLILVNNYRNDKFISHILLMSALLANIFLLIAHATLYLINFR
ncbi:MAG: hypothetical protein UT48_C0004G0006 [Parcubacteria group bacterium GW2011_GWE2_39_37]|uniref:Uncharacterized protein n=1 Tax=Candidatus Falkowbacteria bacterium GW2011_GWF2_39_8 TaxID=1618642 RepID=A0A0G0S8V6_9BACT|nr:MAG: hypothetical protein UT48_C0004G0006 [Parcubacteria group bacterium GW2011_GWE2_39_37]KKR31175.1 MAG: hypothetical protein UT64_C0070G0003 [Candidatus Falkowbacteria bacterium GW2011_GWF2_39_8]